jgi:hypothetical protein
MLIRSVNFKDWLNNLEVSKTWKPDVGDEFLDKVVAAFAASTPVKNERGLYSMLKTMEKVQKDKKTIADMSPLNYAHMVKFIYLCTRGKLLKNQNRNSRLATYTPLFMYAHKLYNDIPYEMWDRTDKDIKFALGKGLESLLKIDREEKLEKYDVAELRTKALTPSTSTKLHPITGYNCNLTKIGGVTVGKDAVRMLLQLWICNSGSRTPNAMILDPYNWDNVPESLDAGVEKTENEPVADWKNTTW